MGPHSPFAMRLVGFKTLGLAIETVCLMRLFLLVLRLLDLVLLLFLAFFFAFRAAGLFFLFGDCVGLDFPFFL